MAKTVAFFRELLENRERWKNNLPPLMIVLGDHGMADAGGHGGKDVCGNSMSTLNKRSLNYKHSSLVSLID